MATVDVTAPPPPPHNLEAEQSVLGAILLSDKAMYGLVIEEGLRPEDFYRDQHRVVYGAMLDLYEDSHGIDVLTVAERLRQGGRLEEVGGEGAIHALAGAVPAAGNVRHYAQIVRENALVRRLLSTTYEIQSSVVAHEGAPRDLVERAERAMLEVAHDDRQKDFRSIEEVLHDELDKLHKLSIDGTSVTGTRSGFDDARRPHRRLPARQPDHPRRPPGHGQVVPGHEHRRERRAEVRRAGGPVLAGDVRDRARPALHRLAELHQG